VSLSTRLAIESPHITTDVINVAVLPYLAIRYGVDNVPTTVVNREKACVGVVTEEQLVEAVVTARSTPQT
jgi:Thioredoxin domain